MGWREKVKSINKKINSVKSKIKKPIIKTGAKVKKLQAKRELQNTQKMVDDLKRAEKRLTELKSFEAIQKKRDEIAKLESRLTLKGQLLTSINKGLDTVMKEGKKQLSTTAKKSVGYKDGGKRRKRNNIK